MEMETPKVVPEASDPNQPATLRNGSLSSITPHTPHHTNSFTVDLSHFKKTPEELEHEPKKIRRFYKDQNDLIDYLLSPIEEDRKLASKKGVKVHIATYGSLFANIILASLQLTAAIMSDSLAIIATMSDSFMDLLSGVILIVAACISKSRKSDLYYYPVGKSRFLTVGIIIFGTLMWTVGIQIVKEAVMRLADSNSEAPKLDAISIALVIIAIGIKLLLYLYCRLISDPSVEVLAQDHRNDILLNSVSITLGILSYKLNRPYLDPAGAIIVALVMLRSWTVTILEQGALIGGKASQSNTLKRILFISVHHDGRIVGVESCRAYHTGEKLTVEVDIMLPPDMPLQIAHDLGESLQGKLEMLKEVERAFVHLDYNATHAPEHQMTGMLESESESQETSQKCMLNCSN